MRFMILAIISSCSIVPFLFSNLLPRIVRAEAGEAGGSTRRKISGTMTEDRPRTWAASNRKPYTP